MYLSQPACDWQDLETAQSFYVHLLQTHIGAPLPVPEGVLREGEAAAMWPRMQAWLRILDLATSTNMLRTALEQQPAKPTAESVLRYLMSASISRDESRDKIDFLITWICRRMTPVESPTAAPPPYGSDASAIYFGRVAEVLRCTDIPTLDDAESKLLKEFDILEAELSGCQQIQDVVAFGIRNRARELKQALGQAFCHPAALASVAAFNIAFGRHFERLFIQGARKLNGEAADLEALAVLIRKAGLLVSDLSEGQAAAPESSLKPPVGVPAGESKPAQTASPDQQSLSPAVTKAEEGALRDMSVTIANQLPSTAEEETVIQLSNTRITLSPAEADAFRTPFKDEKSFRATSAATFIAMVGLSARLLVVFEDFKTRQHSAHLWQQDAKSLASLLVLAARCLERSDAVVATAKGRGLLEKMAALEATRERLLSLCREVSAALAARKAQLSPEPQPLTAQS